MNSIAKFWCRVSGKALRDAREELHSSSQWTREELTKLREQAARNRELEEQAMERALQRVMDSFDDLSHGDPKRDNRLD